MCTHYLHHCGPAASAKGFVAQTRGLRERELSLYCNHLLRLRRQCRRSRFGNEVSDQFLQDYVGRIDFANTAILGYFDGLRLTLFRGCRGRQHVGVGDPTDHTRVTA